MKYGHCSVLAGLMLIPAVDAHAVNWSEDIYQAALSRDSGALESYIRSGINIDATDMDGNTALCMANAGEQWEAYELLLQYGANKNAPCMQKKKSDAVMRNALIGTGLLATGGVVVAAIIHGGSGGGSSSGNNTATVTPDTNTNNNTSGSNSSSGGNNNSSSNNNDNNTTPTPTPEPTPTPDPEPTPTPEPEPTPTPEPEPTPTPTPEPEPTPTPDPEPTPTPEPEPTPTPDLGDNTTSGGGNSGSNSNESINTGNSTVGAGEGNGGNDPLKHITYFTEADFEQEGGIAYDEYWATAKIDAPFNPEIASYEGLTPRQIIAQGHAYYEPSFLHHINAAKAYSKIYAMDGDNNVKLIGYDADGRVIDRSNEHNWIAIVDTGVDANHVEFVDANGASKVMGMNYDYGPCRNGDTTNCFTYNSVKGRADLYGDIPGKVINFTSMTEQAYNDRAGYYTDDYDRDASLYEVGPLAGKILDHLPSDSKYYHGTHVAGIAAASWNQSDSGMMGVAFNNTNIFAVRVSMSGSGLGGVPQYAPIQDIINSGAVAANASYGTSAVNGRNATTTAQWAMEDGYLFNTYLTAYKDLIDSYKYYTNPATGITTTDGVIWVNSAGNETYQEPQVQAGIKRLGQVEIIDNHKIGDYYMIDDADEKAAILEAAKIEVDYSKLMFLVVVSAYKVYNADGTIKYFEAAHYTNACGITADYCIAAPGSEIAAIDDNSHYNGDYSTVPVEYDESGYAKKSGTSMAAPVVTGSIAVLKSAFPYLRSSEIIEILLATADKNGALDRNKNPISGDSEEFRKLYGAGLLDLGRAVTEYIPPASGVSTVSGASVETPYVYMGDANLTVSPGMAEAIADALPESMALFDRYYRPFSVPTANYITVTHAGYKALKNDVGHIVPNTRIKHQQNGNMHFSYASAPQIAGKTGGLGFMDSEYKSDKISAGFFFSENTSYSAGGKNTADLSNPFMSFDTAYGAHAGYDLTPKYGFKLHAMSGRNGLYGGDKDFNDRNFDKKAYAAAGELSFKPNRKTQLSLVSGMLHEDEALLGLTGSGSFGLPESKTYFTGVNVSYKLTPKWTLLGSYYQGWTDAQSFNSNMLRTTQLVSNSFAFDANYKWNNTTDFGFRISSPLRIEHGKLRIDMASGRDYYSDTIYRKQYEASMKPAKREYKFALYGNKEVGENLYISSEFAVRVNPEHRAGSNDYRALFGLSWNF